MEMAPLLIVIAILLVLFFLFWWRREQRRSREVAHDPTRPGVERRVADDDPQRPQHGDSAQG
jgi:hypothetical protein